MGRQLKLARRECSYSPLPPPVMTTVRPLAEKRSDGLIGFVVSMVAVRYNKVERSVWRRCQLITGLQRKITSLSLGREKKV